MRILILAALPQETGPFRRKMAAMRRVPCGTFKAWRGSAAGKEVVLVETGMGHDALRGAFEESVTRFTPDLVLSVGFCGALDRNLSVSRVVVAGEFTRLPHEREGGMPGVLRVSAPEAFWSHMESRAVPRVRIVTVEKPVEKAALARGIPSGRLAVVDMESHVAAALARERALPFLGIRAVSDGLNDGIGFDLDEVTDEAGKVRVVRVLGLVLKRPALIRSLFRHWRRSVRASRSLDEELRAFLGIDSSRFELIVRGMGTSLEAGG